MLERMLKKMSEGLEITTEVDSEAFTLITVTTLHGKEVSRVVSDMEPMYHAFVGRMEKEALEGTTDE